MFIHFCGGLMLKIVWIPDWNMAEFNQSNDYKSHETDFSMSTFVSLYFWAIFNQSKGFSAVVKCGSDQFVNVSIEID